MSRTLCRNRWQDDSAEFVSASYRSERGKSSEGKAADCNLSVQSARVQSEGEIHRYFTVPFGILITFSFAKNH